MECITVTFDYSIKPDKVITILEGNIKQNSNHSCKVLFMEDDGQANVFEIICNCPEAFYLVGMTACSIYENIKHLKK